MRSLAAVLALVVSRAALAADAAPQEEPRWSVGAGILTVVSGPFLPGFAPPTNIPLAQASLERRLGTATWLVVGVAGAFETNDAEPRTVNLLGAQQGGTSWRGQVVAGVRRELTRPAAPLAISTLVLANAGGVTADRKYLAYSSGTGYREVREDTRGLLAGVSAGVAVERQLTSGLSLRIASPLLAGGWSWSEVKPSTGSATHVRSFTGGLTLAPSLELRLAF